MSFDGDEDVFDDHRIAERSLAGEFRPRRPVSDTRAELSVRALVRFDEIAGVGGQDR